mgnify:CR=1 FL=1
MSFEEDIIALAQLREQERQIKEKHALALVEIRTATNAANTFERTVREKALKAFNDFGEVKPHDAISIRIRKTYNFDIPENLKHAIEKLPSAVRINLKNRPIIAEAVIPLIAEHYPETLELDVDALENAFNEGRAPWAKCVEIKTPTVYLKERLGEYVNRDETGRNGDQTTD